MAVKLAPHSVTDPVVLYDSKCGFCRWALAKLLAWDRRGALRPAPIRSPQGEALLADLDAEQRDASWHLVAEGRRYSAGAAFPPLLSLLPGGRPLAWLCARAPRLSEAAYSFVASRRRGFGRLIGAGARRRADQRIARRS